MLMYEWLATIGIERAQAVLFPNHLSRGEGLPCD